jgi:hypothetical protein
VLPIRYPDQWVKLAYVIHWRREGLFSPVVPSGLYYEGGGLKSIEEPLQQGRTA